MAFPKDHFRIFDTGKTRSFSFSAYFREKTFGKRSIKYRLSLIALVLAVILCHPALHAGIASGTLEESDGRTFASLKGSYALSGTQGTALGIFMDGNVINPSTVKARQNPFFETPFIFRPFCFTGNQFPNSEFADFATARELYGSYSVHVAYYDEQFNAVTSANKPGRYAAIVEIRPEKGAVVKRFCTLYRMPENANWPPAKLPVSPELFAQLGINPTVAQEQTGTLEGYLGPRLGDSFANSQDSAIILSWLESTPPGTLPTKRNDPWNTNYRWIYELKRRTGNGTQMEYIVQLPEGAEKSTGKKWPAILYLHPGGGRGMTMEAIGNTTLPGYAKEHKKDFPFILIAPHCIKGTKWEVPPLDDLHEEVMKKYPIDPDRFYLTGESIGGGACWMLAIAHPDRFAAMAPISGNSVSEGADLERVKDLPVWNFHGIIDTDILIRVSYERVETLRKFGGRVRFTVYPEGAHNIWDQVYHTPELYDWLLAQVRGKPAQPRTTDQGRQPTDVRPVEDKYIQMTESLP